MSATTNSAGTQSGTKTKNPLKELLDFGQSVWLDYIRRNLFTSGELARLVNEDGLRGMTSNPAIFEKAIAGSTDYAGELQELAKRKDLDAKGVYELLAIHDIQKAADILKPVYVESKRHDGYVSLEVSPGLAHQTQETIEEARRLWKSGGPRKCDDQSSGHRRRNPRVPAAHQRRHQHQRDAAFRAGRLRARCRGLHRGA